MTLKIIGAGFGRTGTFSTYTALTQLGFPCYHMVEVIGNPQNNGHLDFWLRVAKGEAGSQHDWTSVFAGYTATVDNPGCCVWRELKAAYPEAKVLLTLHPRGPEAWYESTIATIYFTELPQFKALEETSLGARKFGEMSRKLIWDRSLKGTLPDKDKAIARYNAYIGELKDTLPADQLLVFTVDQGWGPLCSFLGVPEPETTFPNLNDRAQIKGLLGAVLSGAFVLPAGEPADARRVMNLQQISSQCISGSKSIRFPATAPPRQNVRSGQIRS